MKALGLIADVWDALTRNELGFGVLLTVGGLTAYVLVVTAIGKTREVFGRKPPISDDLARYGASVEALKKELAGMTPSEKFNALAEKLGGFVTLTQMAALEISLEQQVKDARSYTHKEVHTLRGELAAICHQADERGERLAALEADSKTHTRQNASIEAKIDKLIGTVGKLEGKVEHK